MSKEKITLTKFERLSLVNQFLILKGQGEEEIRKSSYYDLEGINAAIEVLIGGYEGLYNEIIFKGISDPTPHEIVDEVYDILGLYDNALISFNNLNEDERTVDLKSLITFKGFDGNNEHEHFEVLGVIVKNLHQFNDLFDEKEGPRFNSHSRRLSKYRKQLAAIKEYEVPSRLSADELRKVFG